MADVTQKAGGGNNIPFESGKPISARKLNNLAHAIDSKNVVAGINQTLTVGSFGAITQGMNNPLVEKHPFKVYQTRTENEQGTPLRYFWMNEGRFIGPYRVGISPYNKPFITERGERVLSPWDARVQKGLHAGRSVDIVANDGDEILMGGNPTTSPKVFAELTEMSRGLPTSEWLLTEPTYYYFILHYTVWNGAGELPERARMFGDSAAVINNPFIYCHRSPMNNPADDWEHFAAWERPIAFENANDPDSSMFWGHYMWVIATVDNRFHKGEIFQSLRSDVQIWLTDPQLMPRPFIGQETPPPTPTPQPEPTLPPPVIPVLPPPPPPPVREEDPDPDPPVDPNIPVITPEGTTTIPTPPTPVTPTSPTKPTKNTKEAVGGGGQTTKPSGSSTPVGKKQTRFIMDPCPLRQRIYVQGFGWVWCQWGTIRQITYTTAIVRYEKDPPPATTSHPVYDWVKTSDFPHRSGWIPESSIGVGGETTSHNQLYKGSAFDYEGAPTNYDVWF